MSGELGGSGNNKNEWVAARGAVRRVCWSHPEFGQLLATAGAGELLCEEKKKNGMICFLFLFGLLEK